MEQVKKAYILIRMVIVGLAVLSSTQLVFSAVLVPAHSLGDSPGGMGARYDPIFTNKKILIFGDSNTDTQEGKTSWVQPAMAALGAENWINFADGGAAFRRRSIKGVDDMPDQLEKAKGQQGVDIVIVALGTNEYHNNSEARIPSSNNPIVGSFDEAMRKDISQLAVEDTMYDAIRYAFYTIRQRWDCKVYVMLPIQRAAWHWKHVEVLYDALEDMSIAYGFEIIDGRKSGIVSDFEIKGKEGRDLRDGLHPKNDVAKEKIAKTVVAKIRQTFVEL